jgi:hypothetical protein
MAFFRWLIHSKMSNKPPASWQHLRSAIPSCCQTQRVKLSDSFTRVSASCLTGVSGRGFCLQSSPENRCEASAVWAPRRRHGHSAPKGRDNRLCPRFSPALVPVRASPDYSWRADSTGHRRASLAHLPTGLCEESPSEAGDLGSGAAVSCS